jgi:hypothetical protein
MLCAAFADTERIFPSKCGGSGAGTVLAYGKSPAAIISKAAVLLFVFVVPKLLFSADGFSALLAYTLRISLIFRSLLRLVHGTSTEF